MVSNDISRMPQQRCGDQDKTSDARPFLNSAGERGLMTVLTPPAAIWLLAAPAALPPLVEGRALSMWVLQSASERELCCQRMCSLNRRTGD